MTREELYERSFQKVKDGSSFLTVRNFLKYQEANKETINDIMEELKQDRIKGAFYSEEAVKEERSEHFYGAIFSVIMGSILFVIGAVVLYSGWIGVMNISLMLFGGGFFIGGLIKIAKHISGR